MNTLDTTLHMPVQDFLALGLRDIAYIKPNFVQDGETTSLVYEIHTADGTTVGAAESRELAFAAVRQNGLEPLSAH
jgi:hypothetical protein